MQLSVDRGQDKKRCSCQGAGGRIKKGAVDREGLDEI